MKTLPSQIPCADIRSAGADAALALCCAETARLLSRTLARLPLGDLRFADRQRLARALLRLEDDLMAAKKAAPGVGSAAFARSRRQEAGAPSAAARPPGPGAHTS